MGVLNTLCRYQNKIQLYTRGTNRAQFGLICQIKRYRQNKCSSQAKYLTNIPAAGEDAGYNISFILICHALLRTYVIGKRTHISL